MHANIFSSDPMRDHIYADSDGRSPEPFTFNEEVADVFPDMLARSVPGYAATLRLIRIIADQVVTPGSRIYDLGCSLGAASLEIVQQIGDRAEIIAVDNSPAMIDRLQSRLESGSPIEPVCANLQDTEIRNASLTLLNFTLQFVPLADREQVLKRIAGGTRPGGALVLSEKIAFADPKEQAGMTALHEAFKRANGYSDLEISRKRTALEHVLLAETAECHLRRLRDAGFTECTVWFQCFNFISILARKTSTDPG
jgi:tRNA (cmo5U34)-methyltransferase